MSPKKPSGILAYAAVICGGILILSGCLATIGYLGLPLFVYSDDILGAQLGQIAGLILGLVGGGLAVYHGFGSIRGRRSRLLRFPNFYLLLISFALVLGIGNLLLSFQIAEVYLFPPIFFLGAALPTLSVLAWAYRRLSWPLTWRQGILMIVSGSTISILVTMLLHFFIPFIIYLLVEPLGFLAYEITNLFSPGGPGFLERLFFSPMIVVFLVITALEAPIPEEFAKAIGPVLMGRRVKSERGAFGVGLASGAGFAILENMLYEGLYAQWGGWSWGGITALRGIGSVLHPIGTAIIALAWYRERERGSGWFGRLARAYLLSVGLHTLWNGGFMPFVYLTGLDTILGYGPSFSLYGLSIEVGLVIYLITLSGGLWWLLWRYVSRISTVSPEISIPYRFSPRALASLAFGLVILIIPIGAALGQAWDEIRAVMFG